MLALVSGVLCIESCVACLVSSFSIAFRDLCLVACALRHGGLWIVACVPCIWSCVLSLLSCVLGLLWDLCVFLVCCCGVLFLGCVL